MMARPRPVVPVILSVALIAGVCGAIYWPWLGHAGLSSTEGHRAIPGWTMLRTGDWLNMTLFERPYLRKPPGMSWAVAASGAIFGISEWSARAVSALAATLSALVAFVFARAWLGPPWGLLAGVAHALSPFFWGAARSAEIESLHQFGVSLAALSMTDLVIERREFLQGRAMLGMLGLAGGLSVMILAKGPAAAPVILALGAAAWLVLRSERRLFNLPLLIGAGLAGVVVARLGWAVVEVTSDAPRAAVTQGIGHFLWFGPEGLSLGRLFHIVTLAPATLLAALPLSLGIPLVLRRGGWEAHPGEPGARAVRILALGSLLSLVLYTLIGISNTRYAMPGVAFLGPVLAGGARRVWRRGLPPDALMRVRRWGLATGVVLLGVGVAFAWYSSRHRERKSGRAAGIALAEGLARDARLWADHLVEARPEVLWYARERGAESGWEIRPRWVAHERAAENAPRGVYLVLRTDRRSRELEAFDPDRLEAVHTGEVHHYTFTVFRARGTD